MGLKMLRYGKTIRIDNKKIYDLPRMAKKASTCYKILTMPTYNDLNPATYYLIQENEHAGIEMVYVPMVTNKCVLVEYQDDEQTMSWYRKEDTIFEVLEELTDEQAVIYESLFEDDEDDEDWDDEELVDLWNSDEDEEDEDEDEDDDDEDDEDDEDEDDEKKEADKA